MPIIIAVLGLRNLGAIKNNFCQNKIFIFCIKVKKPMKIELNILKIGLKEFSNYTWWCI